jgi:hypothetical protein
MFRRVIETAGFPAFLGVVATYAVVAMLTAVLVADGLTRAPVLWPHLLGPAGLAG